MVGTQGTIFPRIVLFHFSLAGPAMLQVPGVFRTAPRMTDDKRLSTRLPEPTPGIVAPADFDHGTFQFELGGEIDFTLRYETTTTAVERPASTPC